ncbi:MAG TPA: hypothetical protein VFW98_15510 [Gemmatimonadaceae bacterium]|nr:hypothetical protein [Gemmatimonadaceae bacterium]
MRFPLLRSLAARALERARDAPDPDAAVPSTRVRARAAAVRLDFIVFAVPVV